MNKVLVYKDDRRCKLLAWDISDEENRKRAFVDLFRILDVDFDSYNTSMDSAVNALLGMARSGNDQACEALLYYRRAKGHESFEEVEVRRPNCDQNRGTC